MTTDTGKSTTTTESTEREALATSEKKASEQQLGSFKDKETAEKLVTIPPVGPGETPIRGLDSK